MSIDPEGPVVAELSRIAVLILDGAIADLEVEPGRSVDPAGVHDARKQLKRLRALVRLGRGALGREASQAENHAYRDLGRRLSDRRDADALTETVDRLQLAADHEDAGLAASLATLRHAVAGAKAAAGGDDDEVVEDVRAGLVEARDRARSWSGPGDGAWDLLAPGFLRQYGRGRDRFFGLGDRPTDEQLHEWRKRVKDHWYHVELLGAAWPKVLKATAKEVHRLADYLGDDHDLAELSVSWGASVDEPVRELVHAERRRLQGDARTLGRRVFAEGPGRLGRRFGNYWAEPLA